MYIEINSCQWLRSFLASRRLNNMNPESLCVFAPLREFFSRYAGMPDCIETFRIDRQMA
jgi:hypothetical protein